MRWAGSAAGFPVTGRGAAGRVCGVLAALTVALSVSEGLAGVDRLVVRDDAGGALVARLEEIARLRRAGVRVEIRGRYCLSACTLYLGLPHTCVSPETEFGFHGPRSAVYGVSLPPREFERWSRVMARHYPPVLRDWFLQRARHVTLGFVRLRGSALIGLGIARCPS